MIEQIRQQVDDQAEFNLLLSHLQLNPSMSRINIFEKPNSLTQLENMGEPLYFAFLVLTRLDKNLESQVSELADSAPSANLPEAAINSSDDQVMAHQDDQICMPSVMHLLTTYFSFNLTPLPPDFNALVKQYYTKQCRGCCKQLQESAICLLCGEIVCHGNSQKCCGERPGMRKLLQRRQNFYGPVT